MTSQLSWQETEERYRKIFDAARDGILVTEDDGIIIDANPACCNLHVYMLKDLLGQSIEAIFNDECVSKLATLREEARSNGGYSQHVDCLNIRKDGSNIPTEIVAVMLPNHSHIRWLYLIRDISERKNMEFAHLSRINMMGQMAMSLAHELSQPLTAITNYLKGATRHLKEGSSDNEKLSEVMTAAIQQAERAATIIKDLRNFVRRGEFQLAAYDLNKIIKESMAYLDNETQQYHVKIDLKLAKDLPTIFVDKLQLEQAIINIVKNAIEAVRDCRQEHKRVLIETLAITNSHFTIRISDEGPGLSAEAKENIFKPFFTTKKHGIGLGLAICANIIEAHGGHISHTTNDGQGTVFTIDIPIDKRRLEK
ncbi:MAG: PAS domain S-box protein [Gammaproteobacteria bacterium]|nr:PAS domain S-box protein [Gammaproteobacteria bacterium]